MRTKSPQEVVIRPLITEKTLRIAERENSYTFQVLRTANKVQVRDAIERLFDVSVVGVRTQNMIGKFRRVGRSSGATPNWKKAVVKVKEGDTIEFY
ncbi:MAG: 50S ribosomal protein L23 [Planctomycetota bacterium]|nr:50S ribosomal protein L23 [Planctomycetota bacterium]